jgi:hypothetical protein
MPEGVLSIANTIKGMEAISSVNFLWSHIGIEQAETLAGILNAHHTLKSLCGHTGEEVELDMSSKKMGAEGAIMLVPEITGNRALETFTFSGDRYDSKSVTMVISMTEADFNGKNLGPNGAIMLSAFLPKCT